MRKNRVATALMHLAGEEWRRTNATHRDDANENFKQNIRQRQGFSHPLAGCRLMRLRSKGALECVARARCVLYELEICQTWDLAPDISDKRHKELRVSYFLLIGTDVSL